MKGLIALDIDGTITSDIAEIPKGTQLFLESLFKSGWHITLITGRPCSAALRAASNFSFPLTLCAQNGAITLRLPEKSIQRRNYLTKQDLPTLDTLFESSPLNYCIYSGWENSDHVYFREGGLTSEQRSFFEKRQEFSRESYKFVDHFDELPVDDFAAVKVFGESEQLALLSEEIEDKLGWYMPIIKDPISDLFLAQATHPAATKGEGLKDIIRSYSHTFPVIAAGDDFNDLPMLEIADVAIAMATAPESMRARADIIAPPATEAGIITGLEQALKLVSQCQ
jgi:Cof subfamily protein (haloacid dehalogenase superfamily)